MEELETTEQKTEYIKQQLLLMSYQNNDEIEQMRSNILSDIEALFNDNSYLRTKFKIELYFKFEEVRK